MKRRRIEGSAAGGGPRVGKVRARFQRVVEAGPFRSVVLVALLAAAVAVAGGGRLEAQIIDQATYTYVALDQLEYAPGLAERPMSFSGELWHGGDYNRLWVKADGERSTMADVGELEVQALYGRFVAPFWDAQVGLRLDTEYEGSETDLRAHLALGLQGLAPYWFEVEPTFFVSQDGDVSARLDASYELLATQRWILEPELELDFAVQDVPEWGTGSGLSDLGLGARLRYEIVRELAPYVGISWERSIGATADLARADGEKVGRVGFVAGVRAWW